MFIIPRQYSIMDKTMLVGFNAKEGQKLLYKLDQSGLKVTSAFWCYMDEYERYRLVIVTPFFDKHGVRKTYEKIQKVLRSNEDIDLSLETVLVMSPDARLNKAMRTKFRTGTGISGIRLTGNVIDGTYIEDAYLYRVN